VRACVRACVRANRRNRCPRAFRKSRLRGLRGAGSLDVQGGNDRPAGRPVRNQRFATRLLHRENHARDRVPEVARFLPPVNRVAFTPHVAARACLAVLANPANLDVTRSELAVLRERVATSLTLARTRRRRGPERIRARANSQRPTVKRAARAISERAERRIAPRAQTRDSLNTRCSDSRSSRARKRTKSECFRTAPAARHTPAATRTEIDAPRAHSRDTRDDAISSVTISPPATIIRGDRMGSTDGFDEWLALLARNWPRRHSSRVESDRLEGNRNSVLTLHASRVASRTVTNAGQVMALLPPRLQRAPPPLLTSPVHVYPLPTSS